MSVYIPNFRFTLKAALNSRLLIEQAQPVMFSVFLVDHLNCTA